MRIVVDMPEGIYKVTKLWVKQFDSCRAIDILFRSIVDGQILPKGHGRLFDERDIVNGNYKIIGNKIYELEPVIEADIKESEE